MTPDLLLVLVAGLATVISLMAVAGWRLVGRVRELEAANVVHRGLGERTEADIWNLFTCVGSLTKRVAALESRPAVTLPSPAAEDRVTALVAIGHTEPHARDIAQAELLDAEPVTEPVADAGHSRLADVAAFRKA